MYPELLLALPRVGKDYSHQWTPRVQSPLNSLLFCSRSSLIMWALRDSINGFSRRPNKPRRVVGVVVADALLHGMHNNTNFFFLSRFFLHQRFCRGKKPDFTMRNRKLRRWSYFFFSQTNYIDRRSYLVVKWTQKKTNITRVTAIRGRAIWGTKFFFLFFMIPLEKSALVTSIKKKVRACIKISRIAICKRQT